MTKLLFVSVVCLGLAATVAGRQQTPVDLQVGDRAPDLSLPGSDGKTHRLSDYKGKAVVLAWFSAAFTGG